MATVSPADERVVAARIRLPGGSAGALGAFVLGAALLVAVHLIGMATAPRGYPVPGSRLASPLVLGEWLFTLGLALVVLVLALALGRTLARPLLLGDDPLSDQLAALGIGFGALSLSILGLGVLHLYYGPLFLLGALLLVAALRHELQRMWREVRALGQRGRPRMPLIGTPGQRALLVLLACTCCFVCLRNMIPVVGDVPDFDGVTYHLSGPKLELAAHRILPMPDVLLANAPAGIEMLAVVGMAAKTDTLMKVLNLLFAVGLGLAVYAFGRRHLAPEGALYGVFLLFTPFWVIELAPGTVPDFGTAFFLVLGVSDGLAWLGRLEHEGGGSRGRPLPITGADRLLVRAGLLLGISIACKLTSGPALPAMALTVGLACLGLRGLPWHRRLEAAVRGGALLVLAGLLPLAPWLLKNLIFFGNPLYPAAGLVNGANCRDNNGCTAYVAHHVAIGLPGRLAELWAMVGTVADLCWRFGGPLSAALVFAPLVLRRPAARQALLFLLIGAVLWFKLVPLFLPPRYWLGLIAIAEAITAATLWEAVRRLPLRPALVDLPLLAYLLPAGLLTLAISIGLAQRSGAFDLIGGAVSRHDYLADRVRPYEAFDWVNGHTPPDAAVVTLNTSLGYYLDRPYLNDWFGARYNRLLGDHPAQIAEIARWCRAGVRYAVFNRGLKEYNIDSQSGIRPLGAYRWTALPGLDTRVLFSWRGVDVLSLRPCAVARAGATS